MLKNSPEQCQLNRKRLENRRFSIEFSSGVFYGSTDPLSSEEFCWVGLWMAYFLDTKAKCSKYVITIDPMGKYLFKVSKITRVTSRYIADFEWPAKL